MSILKINSLSFALGVLAVCFVAVNAQCPSPSELPTSIGGRKYCAIAYQNSDHDKERSCNGQTRQFMDGDAVMKLQALNDQISAIVVQHDCCLTVYQHADRAGDKRHFRGGTHTHLASLKRGFWGWDSWNDVISSVDCVCGQSCGGKLH